MFEFETFIEAFRDALDIKGFLCAPSHFCMMRTLFLFNRDFQIF